ncbi:MAG: hypothetical protein KGY68_07300 [Candidatus Thermoplasmatota archaeon]|nr:hypothetical protein [Candidatus Thermoplasmatota archaeon]
MLNKLEPYSFTMSSHSCPECGKEMEEVVGFSGYGWCRDCHITKKVETEGDEEKVQSSSGELKT